MTTEIQTNATAASTKWTERFGTLESIVVREGKNGTYATFLLDCSKFKQSGIAFGETAAAIIAAGVGTKAWMKGPLETRPSKREGRETDTSYKAVYFRLRGENGAEPAGEPVQADDLTALKGIGPKAGEKLAAEGVTSYAQIASLSDEALAELDAKVSAVRGTLIRAGVREAAAAMIAAADEARAAEENAFA